MIRKLQLNFDSKLKVYNIEFLKEYLNGNLDVIA